MLKPGEKIGQGMAAEEVFTMVFGEEFRYIVEDDLSGSKEELEIFREVYCDGCTSTKPLSVTSFSSIIDSSPGQASKHTEMKSEPEHTYRGRCRNLVCSDSSGLVGNIDYGVSSNYQCRIQTVRDVKIVEGKSVTSPISQESVASGFVLTGAAFAPTETPSTITCIKERGEVSANLDAVGVASKRHSTRDLPSRVELYAHCLLVDAGWEIENRARLDRKKLAYYFLKPGEGLVFKALSAAWKACGEKLLEAASDSERDENGREWADIDTFWRDITDTLAYIDKATHHKEGSLSLLHRWQLLDPFMAVVWIDKKVGALRAGRALKAVKSTTYILSQSTKMFLADRVVNRVNRTSGEVSFCSVGSLTHSTLQVPQNSEVIEGSCSQQPLAIQVCHNIQSRLRCAQAEGNCSCCTDLRKQSLKSLARGIGKGLHNDECLHMSSKGPISRRKRSKRSSNKSSFMQKDSSFSFSFGSEEETVCTLEKSLDLNTYVDGSQPLLGSGCTPDDVRPVNALSKIQPYVGNTDFSVECNSLPHMSLPVCQEMGPILQVAENMLSVDATKCTLKQTIVEKLADGSNKKARKKSKKISEIEAPEVSDQCMKTETDDKCTEDFALSMDDSNGELKSRRSNFHISTSKRSKKQKLAPDSNKAPNEMNDHKISAHDGTISQVFQVEKIGDSVLNNGHVSADLLSNLKSIMPNKSECKKKNGGKKAPRGRIHDDDLLITAIFKKKNFGSCGQTSTKSKALGKIKSQKGCLRLLPRALGKGGNDGKEYILGARTVLCWLIEMGSVSLKDIIQFRNPKNSEVVKDGWVTREGILCKCCSEIFSVSSFAAHAGFKQQSPSLHLFVQKKPYTLCQLLAWSTEYKRRKSRVQVLEDEEADQSDDTCALCGDGGDLVCCDSCPSTYHQSCLYVEQLPEGNWYCPNCICMTCGDVANGKEASSSLAVFKCLQCEHKYHETCAKRSVPYNGQLGSSMSLCGQTCQEVYMGFRPRVGVMNHIEDELSWSILRCSHDLKVGSPQKIALMAECNAKLAIALSLMEECFVPMVDPRTGIEMISHVLYNWGSKFARLNYQGFYAVVLEKGDALVSVASIRVHGVTVAEMPLIATCSTYRRQGMCRRLLNEIEKLLISFKVKMLVLSAIPSLVETWTSGFGFSPVEDEEKRQLSNVNLMLFPGTTLLKRNLHETSAEGSGQNINLDSREGQSQICEDLVEVVNTLAGEESAEKPENNSEVAVKEVDTEQRERVNSLGGNAVPTTWRSGHGDATSIGNSCVRTETFNTAHMDQSFLSGEDVTTEVSVDSISTVVNFCAGYSTPTATNGETSLKRDFDKNQRVVTRDMEENASHEANIRSDDVDASSISNERTVSYECDPYLSTTNQELRTVAGFSKTRDVAIRDVEENSSRTGNTLSEVHVTESINNGTVHIKEISEAKESAHLGASNLNEMNGGGMSNSDIPARENSNCSKDENCGFVGRNVVAKSCTTTGSVEV